MAHIGASISQLDLAGGEFDWATLAWRVSTMVQLCVWFDSAVVLSTARQSNGLSFGLCTIRVSYSGEIASLGQYLCMIFF